MMKARIPLLLLALSWATPVWSYSDKVTHRDLSRRAFDISRLNTDPELIKTLGLSESAVQIDWNLVWPEISCDENNLWDAPMLSDVGALTPRESLAQGAIDEDVFPRMAHHFYDPVNDTPLWFVPWAEKSPDWSLEPGLEFTNQNDSFRDARRSMYLALTTPGPKSARDEHWNSTFLKIGHVIHHLQDMAQPQHVRDDGHVPPFDTSLYENYAVERCVRVRQLASSAQAVFPGPGASAFKAPSDFWKNSSGTGIAESSNRDYLSEGSNYDIGFFGDLVPPVYASPRFLEIPTDYTVAEMYALHGEQVPTQIQWLCDEPLVNCTMTMYSTPRTARASTLSIFDQDLRAAGLRWSFDYPGDEVVYYNSRLFALNRFNYTEVQEQLIPRAVSYSAGMINYFFRGKLEISPPTQGVYAFADHSAGLGFTEIKAKVKNATPGEAMTGGTVVGVVKFRRNGCYKPDLSGEFARTSTGEVLWPVCEGDEVMFPPEEFIIKSAEQSLSLSSGGEQELTFVLPEPVPFAATDVYLQVIYRGPLGQEGGAVAVGTADISEPTYVAIFNATDLFAIPNGTPSGGLYYYRDIIDGIAEWPFSIVDLDEDDRYESPPDVYILGGDLSFDVSFGGEMVANILRAPEGRFARIAVLAPPTFNLHLRAYTDYGETFHTALWQARENQINWELRAREITSLFVARNGLRQCGGAVIYFGRYRTGWPDITNILPSLAPGATEPFPARIPPALATAPGVSRAAGAGEAWVGQSAGGPGSGVEWMGHSLDGAAVRLVLGSDTGGQQIMAPQAP